MPQIRRIDIPQLVRVRKYEVDCQRLCDLLREHKRLMGKSNKQLAEALNVPPTQVEHWFRKDSCFSIPGEDIWEALKDELSITTTEFDKSILTFEERPGVYEKSERCYFADGIAPTLTSTSAGNEKIIVEEMNMDKPVCLNSKGGRKGIAGLQPSVQDRVYDSNASATAVTACYRPSYAVEDANRNGTLRIRKLTPMECFRLMGFDDADYEMAAAVNSNTQSYKQAGNSIGVPVVQHILKALIDCGALAQG